MAIEIYNLSSLKKDKIQQYTREIAEWYFTEWGKVAKLSTEEFLQGIITSFKNGAVFFVAVNTANNDELIGSISLQKKCMEDDNTYTNIGPWLDGFYVKKDYRNHKIGTQLAREVVNIAITEDIEKIYYFTHNLLLKEFYQKFGGTLLNSPNYLKPYQYKEKTILLFEANPKDMLKIIDHYLKETKIKEEEENLQVIITNGKL